MKPNHKIVFISIASITIIAVAIITAIVFYFSSCSNGTRAVNALSARPIIFESKMLTRELEDERRTLFGLMNSLEEEENRDVIDRGLIDKLKKEIEDKTKGYDTKIDQENSKRNK